MRDARRYIERLSNEELIGLWQLAKKETTQEGQVIYYLLTVEMNKRKIVTKSV